MFRSWTADAKRSDALVESLISVSTEVLALLARCILRAECARSAFEVRVSRPIPPTTSVMKLKYEV